MIDKQRAQNNLIFDWPSWILPIIDMGLILVAFLAAHFARYELQLLRPLDEAFRAEFGPYMPYALLYGAWLIFSMQQANLYHHVRGRSLVDETVSIANGATNALFLIMGFSFAVRPLVFSRLLLLYAAIISALLLALARVIYRWLRTRQQRRGIGVERVLVVGAGEISRAVMRNTLARPDLGYQVVGFVDDDPERSQTDIGRLRALGPINKLPVLIVDEHIDLVIVTLPWQHQREILQIVRECDRQDVQVRFVPDMFQLQMSYMEVENLEGIPLLGIKSQVVIPRSERLLKRAIDIALVVLAAPIWLPLVGLIALAIRLEDSGPVFYGQERVGQGGRSFRAWKFRSMVENADALWAKMVEEQGLDPRHPKLKNDPRVTRVGRFIRRTSLDELPQLFNILNGEMSIVGPRPPTPDEVALYEPWHRERLKIRGGLTGLWQVSGRSDVPFEEMVLLDLYYIENWSLLLDLQIILRTIPRVLLGDGAY